MADTLDLDLLKATLGDSPHPHAVGAVISTTEYDVGDDAVAPPTFSSANKGEPPTILVRGEGDRRSVVLDTVASSANRVEDVVLRQHVQRDVTPALPEMRLEASVHGEHLTLSCLEWPHRSGDMYLWSSILSDGTPFRESQLGRRFDSTRPDRCLPLFQHLPYALLFGTWHSNLKAAKKNNRALALSRAFHAETVGINPQIVGTGASRVDPILKTAATLEAAGDNPADFVFIDLTGDGKKDKFRRTSEEPEKINASVVGLGNFPPTVIERLVTIERARRRSVLSMAALRRLHFGEPGSSEAREPQHDVAGRAVLAALGLYADRLFDSKPDVHLRSRCVFNVSKRSMTSRTADGQSIEFNFGVDDGLRLLQDAVDYAASVGLVWKTDVTTLRPDNALQELIEAALPNWDELYKS